MLYASPGPDNTTIGLLMIGNTLPGERFMVKDESAASVGTKAWTPEGRSLTLSIAFPSFTPWATLPGEKKTQTNVAHSTQGHHPRHDEAA
ncbi:hypothetical protein AVEN_9781-1 [Araneus ventricosus]|uniref:Uncharacterized protein n=1 Tax=Araneus ventricosus TaxID=182803 RepID=A0A4Y2EPX7_ARAVE|nr:hypothetical protein AVEN_9781-1 [Araneus ventricosus]